MAISFKHHYKSDSLIGTGTIKFRRYSITSPLSLSYALTNCTADSTNPTEIIAGKTYDFSFTADSGYEFTGSGTTSVSGGTVVAWDYPDSSDLTRITVAIEVTGNLTITQIASVALPQLATPQNVSADGTTVSWDEVENATSYAVLADGSEIGTVEGVVTEDELPGTWVINTVPNISTALSCNINFNSDNENFSHFEIVIRAKGNALQYDQMTAFDEFGGWTGEYQTITITSKLSEVTDGDTLLAWLQANATKQSTTAPTLISFTIAGTSYQAEEGMTWAEWVNSSYNTDGYYVDGTYIANSKGRIYTSSSYKTPVVNTDIIVSGHEYYNSGSGGGAGN